MVEKLAERVLRLADLVKYQEGSIVSRTLIDGESGTVTVFAFDEGQGLSEHTAPFEAMVVMLEGQAEITINGESFNLVEGLSAVSV